MTKENQIKVECKNCKFEIAVPREELVADENNLARVRCPKCDENNTIDLGIPEEEG